MVYVWLGDMSVKRHTNRHSRTQVGSVKLHQVLDIFLQLLNVKLGKELNRCCGIQPAYLFDQFKLVHVRSTVNFFGVFVILPINNFISQLFYGANLNNRPLRLTYRLAPTIFFSLFRARNKAVFLSDKKTLDTKKYDKKKSRCGYQTATLLRPINNHG